MGILKIKRVNFTKEVSDNFLYRLSKIVPVYFIIGRITDPAHTKFIEQEYATWVARLSQNASSLPVTLWGLLFHLKGSVEGVMSLGPNDPIMMVLATKARLEVSLLALQALYQAISHSDAHLFG